MRIPVRQRGNRSWYPGSVKCRLAQTEVPHHYSFRKGLKVRLFVGFEAVLRLFQIAIPVLAIANQRSLNQHHHLAFAAGAAGIANSCPK